MFKNQDIRCRLRARSRIHVLSSGLNSFNFIMFNIIGSQEKAIQYFHLGYCLAFFLIHVASTWIRLTKIESTNI